jgi:hypothetical protein
MVVVNNKIYGTFTLTVRIPSLGKVRLVISYENKKLTDTFVVLVTSCLDRSAKRIIETHLLRWPIEMMQNCRDAKFVFTEREKLLMLLRLAPFVEANYIW